MTLVHRSATCVVILVFFWFVLVYIRRRRRRNNKSSQQIVITFYCLTDALEKKYSKNAISTSRWKRKNKLIERDSLGKKINDSSKRRDARMNSWMGRKNMIKNELSNRCFYFVSKKTHTDTLKINRKIHSKTKRVKIDVYCQSAAVKSDLFSEMFCRSVVCWTWARIHKIDRCAFFLSTYFFSLLLTAVAFIV